MLHSHNDRLLLILRLRKLPEIYPHQKFLLDPSSTTVPPALLTQDVTLEARGVGCGVYYPTPVHRLPSFNADIDLPETERAAAECLSLPVHPALTDAELDEIVTAVNEVAERG